MPYRQGTFREKFTTHELSKLEFRKLNGYYFAKKNRQDPTYSWMLIKDDTSAVIKYLCYVQATKEQLLEFMGNGTRMKKQIFDDIFHPDVYSHPQDIHTMEDLEAAVIELHYTPGADALKQSFNVISAADQAKMVEESGVELVHEIHIPKLCKPKKSVKTSDKSQRAEKLGKKDKKAIKKADNKVRKSLRKVQGINPEFINPSAGKIDLSQI